MTHTVTRQEIEHLLIMQGLAASIGKGEHKKLVAEMSVDAKYREFVVTNHGKEQRFISLDDAIEAYNEAR